MPVCIFFVLLSLCPFQGLRMARSAACPRQKGLKAMTKNISLNDLINSLGTITMQEKAPTAKCLRETAGEPVAASDDCVVYANGYAVYHNVTGTVVLWIEDCRPYVYNFDAGSVKQGIKRKDEQDLSALPWDIAVTVYGDHKIEANSYNRTGDRKKEDEDKAEEKWNAGCRFENPEAAYLRKEMIREALEKMTDKQREVYVLHYVEGYTEYEIADFLGIDHTSVRDRLKTGKKRVSKRNKGSDQNR